VSTAAATILTLLCFGIAGLVPARAVIGWRGPVLAFAILIGAAETAVAGACSLLIAWSTLPWFIIVAAGIAAVSSAFLVRRRRDRPISSEDSHPLRTLRSRLPGTAVVVALSVTLGWCLVPLRVPSVGWDARAIWLLRSSWFARGHGFLVAAFRSPGALIAHASYPPLISTAVASSWQLTGNHGDRLGVAIVALLNASATMATAWVIVEVGRNIAHRQSRDMGLSIANGAGAVGAVLFTFIAFGTFGPFATNGYADPLWSVAAVGATGYGLILPRVPGNLGASIVLLAVSGLTKTEGTGTAVVLILLITFRYSYVNPNRHRESIVPTMTSEQKHVLGSFRSARWSPIATGLAALVGLSLWPIVAHLEHAGRNVNTSGAREGTWTSRTHLTLTAIAPHLHVLLVAIPVALASGVLLKGYRTKIGLGNDLWAWLALLGGLSVITLAYVTGPGNTAFWLLTSVHRTTMFAATAAWLIIAVSGVTAATSISDRGSAKPQTSAPHGPGLLTRRGRATTTAPLKHSVLRAVRTFPSSTVDA
jgi:hypothetical protein